MHPIDRIARAYLGAAPIPGSELLWRAVAARTAVLYSQLQRCYCFEPVNYPDRYVTAAAVRRDLRRGVLRVYDADHGHPVFTAADNFRFRAVHDVLGHATRDATFSFHGERAAFRNHARYYPLALRPVLYSEIVGQAACYFAQGNIFAEQRLALLPEDICS